jgi:uncharacterized membrane protein YfcA
VTLGLLAVLPVLSLIGAVVSGLLGVGGAIVMIPLLLYGPPLLGVGELDIRAVSAITMVQVFVAAVSGMLAHRRHRAVNPRLAVVGGVAMSAGSLTGALVSKLVPDEALLVVFAAMVTVAAGFMFVRTPQRDVLTPGQERPFSRSLTVLVALVVGFGAGLVGAGGAFLLVPLLLVVVGMPIRVTIGSSLAITALAALAGVVGKFVTGQIPLLLALVVALGALPGARLGAALSRRMSGTGLKVALFVIILITGVRVWWDVLWR